MDLDAPVLVVVPAIFGVGAEASRKIYADALYEDPGATLVDLREAVTTLEDTARIARRVFGGAHPLTRQTEQALQQARAALRAREASA